MTLYKTIVADPPWSYQSKHSGGTMTSGAADKYPLLSLDQIRELPVKKIANRDAILFLWITTPLKSAILQSRIVESWGFEYKTSMYWIKTGRLGMGYWWRGNVEECLVCTRGRITAFRESTPNIITAPVGKHSEKPEAFWEKIEPIIAKWDLNPKVELFARTRRDGWNNIGNEIDGSDIFSVVCINYICNAHPII